MDTKQFAHALQQLSNSYIDAYANGAQRYLDLLAQMNKSDTAPKEDPGRQQRYTEFVRNEGPRALKQLADASLNYYTAVLNTGIEASNRFFDQVLQEGQAPSIDNRPPKSRQALLFRGKRGESPSNAFRVSNNQNESVDVGFTIAEITSEDGKERLQPAARFEPSNPKLQPGSEQVVVCTLQVPDSLRQDTTYRGQIHVTGFPSMAIDIAVQVDDVEEAPPPANKKPARKKTTARKARAKTTTRKSRT